MSEELRSVLVGAAGLTVALTVAAALTVVRHPKAWADVRPIVPVAILTIAIQAAHATEEFVTGFHVRFPATLGVAAWSPEFFVWFNVVCLALWIGCLWPLAARWRVAFLPLWFLGLAGTVNGLAHPLLAVNAGGYFPGLATSPLVGLTGVALLRRLASATASSR